MTRRQTREPRHFPPATVPFMTAPQRDALIVKLRGQGWSYRRIGAVTGMSANGVMQALRRIEGGGGPGRDPRA